MGRDHSRIKFNEILQRLSVRFWPMVRNNVNFFERPIKRNGASKDREIFCFFKIYVIYNLNRNM